MGDNHKVVGSVVLMDKHYQTMQHVGTLVHTKSGLVVHPASKKKKYTYREDIGVPGFLGVVAGAAGVLHYGGRKLRQLDLWLFPPKGDGIHIGHVEDNSYLPSEASGSSGGVRTNARSAFEGIDFEDVDAILRSNHL